MSPQSVQRAGQSNQNWPPLVCICGLCECGGHKCSDFNDWLAAQDRNPSTPLEAGLDTACANSHDHSCNYTAAGLLDERYLTRNGSVGNQRQHLSRPRHSTDSPSKPNGLAQASTPASTPKTRDDNGDEVLHVLVARPQVASKPRDNIIFEGDMDLRTTFETSYEALARTRLEHWRRHQELKARRSRSETVARQDVSEETTGGRHGQAATATPIRRELHGSLAGRPPSDSRLERADDEDEHESAPPMLDDVGSGPIGSRDEGPIDASAPKPTRATMIRPPTRSRTDTTADQSAASKQLRRPLVFGPVLSLDQAGDGRPAAGFSAQPATAPTTEQRKQQQHRRRQDHFIDPDLSPIIVYDANLNRLERVGLRKRSKYRPSTSLRPGGRDFFGPTDGHDHEQAKQDGATEQSPTAPATSAGDQMDADDRGSQKRGANSVEPSEKVAPARGFDVNLTGVDHHGLAAGASSETLNKGQIDCGRKHHLAHVNRIDHIKQMNLVENSYSATLTNGDIEPSQQDDRQVNFVELGNDDRDRQLAQEEEDAAIAEIQRLVVDDNEYRVAHRNQPSSSSSRQSTRLVRHNTIASPSETTAVATTTANREQMVSPASSRGDKSSSRQSRLERVCQNQSFFLFENEYPGTRGDALDDKRCVKIGEPEIVEHSNPTMELQSRRTSSQSAHVRQNLFRESPDFIMTTGQAQVRLPLVEDNPNQRKASRTGQYGASELESTQNVGQNEANRQTGQVSEELDQRIGTPGDTRKCRVLDLGYNFEFVGSRSGHKYFVEKQTMSTPMSEIG